MLETQTPSCWWFCLISAPVSKFFPAGLFGVLPVTTYNCFCEPSKSIFRRNTTETKMKRSKNIKLQRDILNIWTWRFWEQTIEKLARAWWASLMREIDTFESLWRRTDRKCDFSRSKTWKSRGRSTETITCNPFLPIWTLFSCKTPLQKMYLLHNWKSVGHVFTVVEKKVDVL